MPDKEESLLVYYAHPMNLYGTLQEERNPSRLSSSRSRVLNPNQPEHQEGCQKWKEPRPKDLKKVKSVMGYFINLIEGCDALAFRAFPCGQLGSGVWKEIEAAQLRDIPVFEIPSGLTRRKLTKGQTRAYLEELGQR